MPGLRTFQGSKCVQNVKRPLRASQAPPGGLARIPNVSRIFQNLRGPFKGPSEIRNAGRVAGAFLTGLTVHGLVCSRDEFLSLFRGSITGRAAYAFSRPGLLHGPGV